MRPPERALAAPLAGRHAVLVEHVDVAPPRARVGEQATRRQGHEQGATEVILAIREGDSARGGDLTGQLPRTHGGAPQAKALAVAVRAPKFARPRIRLAPSVDNTTRLGVIEVDPVVQ